jgi:precorrin-8X/cobalt-precorrin-8 methylmutase
LVWIQNTWVPFGSHEQSPHRDRSSFSTDHCVGAGVAADRSGLDHPIFTESIRLIRTALSDSASSHRFALEGFSQPEQEVLLRLIHSSGDLSLAPVVRFSPTACVVGLEALAGGAAILTDTAMAAAAVAPMARRTFGNAVHSVLNWAPAQAPAAGTRAAAGMERALELHPGAVVLIGSAPTALELLLDQVTAGRTTPPALVIGMPVGFVGVAESKRRLAESGLPQIRLDGSRGGAGLVGAAVNALLRRAWLDQATAT